MVLFCFNSASIIWAIRSVSAKEEPSGVSALIKKMGFSDFGKMEKPILFGICNDPANNTTATAKVGHGLRNAQCSNLVYEPLMPFFKALIKIFPSDGWPLPLCDSFKMRLLKNGTMVSDTTIEAKMVMVTANGKLRINWPEASGKKLRGKNAKTSVTVQPMTASVICLVALMAASRLP